MAYTLSYDRKNNDDPLNDIVRILFNHGATEIRKRLASTLSFEHKDASFLIEKKYHDELSEVCYFLITDGFMADSDLNDTLVNNGNEEIDNIIGTLI
jgi:hypothetical protein